MLNKHYAGFAHHTFHHESHVGLRSSFVFFSILMTGSHSVSRHSGPDSDQTRSRLGPGLWPVNLSHVKYQLPAVITITPPSLLSAKYFDERKQKISNNFDSRLLFFPFSSHIFAGLERSGYLRWKIYMLPVSSFLSRCNNLASYRVLIIIPVTPIRLVITIISGLKSPLWPVSRTRAQVKRESRTFRTFFLLAALDKFHSLNSQYLSDQK